MAFDQALADYDRAARLAPKDAKISYERGLARVEVKQFEGALADFDTAIRLDPRYDEA
jgi:tetratricopeptide (TPR) repeat protein